MADDFLRQLAGNPHGLGWRGPVPTAPDVTYDEYGQPWVNGQKVTPPPQPSAAESLLNIAESPAKVATAFAGALSPYGSEGWQVPQAAAAPMNALMRLIGTPSNPGTFTQGPGYGSNADDMRTLLETFLGGNATRGMGAVERAAPDIGFLDSLKGKYLDYMHPDEYTPIGGSRMVRDYAGGNPANGMPLDPTVVSGLLNHHTPGFMGFPANSARGWTPSVVHSDQLPSLWGSALQGQQNPQHPNSLFTY